jgi:hypothetical protein
MSGAASSFTGLPLRARFRLVVILSLPAALPATQHSAGRAFISSSGEYLTSVGVQAQSAINHQLMNKRSCVPQVRRPDIADEAISRR